MVLCGVSIVLLWSMTTHAADGKPEPVPSKHVEHFYRLGTKIFSGAQPHGEAAFQELQSKGIKTIISVDGAKPDVETAKRFNLRYVHLPIGYDGITPERELQIVKAARTLPGPIFVHCHHGKHRGPAAAAICCCAVEDWNVSRALSWLKSAGTSPKYVGLFRTIREFQMPTDAQLAKVPEKFPEIAAVPTLVKSMVAIDGYWEHLQWIQQAGFKQPPAHPDLDPPHEALQLAEHFRELTRTDDAKEFGKEYLTILKRCDTTAMKLHETLTTLKKQRRDDLLQSAEKSMQQLQQQCAQCHRRFRNGSPE